MSRATGVQENRTVAGTRHILAKVKRKLGRVSPGMRIRALDPKLLRASVEMDFYIVSKGELPGTLKELAQLKVAMMTGCPF
ncbi:MAG TPA: carboxymuconolactone decarboxylase family protein [Candidatus Acidoferrum sp.]|nr:carboxymuconolactone decarboxylase family protein [Candidatus Acidoferrum sp.]